LETPREEEEEEGKEDAERPVWKERITPQYSEQEEKKEKDSE